MTIINFSNFTAANSTVQYIQAVNTDLTGGWFGILIVIALFTVLFIRLMYYNIAAAFLAAGFITATLSTLLWMVGIVPLFVLIITLILPMIGMFLVKFDN